MVLDKEPLVTEDPFVDYKREGDPSKQERRYAWQTAIGLQAVDGLETSDYLKTTAGRNVAGEITFSQAQALIDSYYQTDRKTKEPRMEEADKVSSRIAAILSERGFTFSVAQYLSIHKRLFDGLFRHAGQIRDYNISKQEWVLDGDSVTYGNYPELSAMLDYDFSEERAFDYSGLSMDEVIRHLAHFVSRLWQIHVFGEGNTRATAVFFIKYLQSLGFDVTNDIFAKNAWYFRNAMVRANYNNLKKGIHETTAFLERFLRNLLLGENNPLQNRTMHVRGILSAREAGPIVPGTEERRHDFDRLTKAGISIRSTNNALTLYDLFGTDRPFGRMDIATALGITKSPASDLLTRLLSVGAIETVAGFGKGKYRFSTAFFKE